jgi:hypothetical protein
MLFISSVHLICWVFLNSRKQLIDQAANVMADGALTIRCDIVIIASDVDSVTYDFPQPSKRRQTSILSDLDKMLTSSNFSDFKIVCQTNTYDVHKAILAARYDFQK